MSFRGRHAHNRLRYPAYVPAVAGLPSLCELRGTSRRTSRGAPIQERAALRTIAESTNDSEILADFVGPRARAMAAIRLIVALKSIRGYLFSKGVDLFGRFAARAQARGPTRISESTSDSESTAPHNSSFIIPKRPHACHGS